MVVPMPTLPALSIIIWLGRAFTTFLELGIPMAEVITRLPEPVWATAQKEDSSAAQHTDNHWLSAVLALVTQVMPSGEVMIRLPVPVIATAQKSDNSGAQHTLYQSLSAALARVVHIIPSGEVMT